MDGYGTTERTADSAVGPQPAAVAGSEFVDLDRIEAGLADVQGALDRLDDGTYGRCEQCDGEIDDERLESSPSARFCRDHLPFQPVP